MYVPAITVRGQTYFDRGLHCNNPVVELVKEVGLEFPNHRIDTVVSIGTGRWETVDPEPYANNILLSFGQRGTDTEARHEELMQDNAFKDIRAGYFRFQGSSGLGEMDFADAEGIDEIERHARHFLDSDNGNRLIESCAARLASS